MDGHGAPEQAGLDLFHSLSARAVASDDERGLAGDRPGKMVQQPQAGLVGLVHVVDGEQQAGPGGREAQQFRGGDEQPLVGPLPVPGQLVPSQGSVDLLAECLVEPVEQSRMLPAQVGECVEDGRVWPGALNGRRDAVSGPPSAVFGPFHPVEQRRFPHARRTGHQDGPASSVTGLGQ